MIVDIEYDEPILQPYLQDQNYCPIISTNYEKTTFFIQEN